MCKAVVEAVTAGRGKERDYKMQVEGDTRINFLSVELSTYSKTQFVPVKTLEGTIHQSWKECMAYIATAARNAPPEWIRQ